MHKMFHFHPNAEQVLDWILHILAMVHVGLATSIIVGGPIRFQNPTLRPLYDILGGQVWIWGFSIFLSGVLMIAPHIISQAAGLWVGMCWHFFWMACCTVAISRYSNAAATTIPIYGGFALICTILLAVKVIKFTTRE